MKQGKSRVSQTAALLPKALLPDPDSLLIHIDRAVVSTEYARASQFLANVPPGPHLLSFPSLSNPPTTVAALKEENSKGRAGRRLPALLVEEFLHKLVTGGEGRESSRHAVPFIARKNQPCDRPRSEASPVNNRVYSVNSINTSTKLKLNTTSALQLSEISEDFTPHRVRPQPRPLGNAPEIDAANIQQGGVLVPSKFSFFQPGRPNTKRGSLISPPIQSNDGTAIISCGIDRSKLENSHLFSNSIDSSSKVFTAKGSEGTVVTDSATPQSNVSRRYDAAAADQAYRAGSAAMEEGDMVQAIALLRLASIKCPRDRPSALLKIEKLITAATHELEMQEASRNISQRVVSNVEVESSKAEEAMGYQMPMKVLEVGDMLKAEEAYRAGVAALETGKPAKALEHLRRATLACPEDRQTAACKIQTLIEQANFELRMR